MRRRKFMPYIRRARSSDRGGTIRAAFMLTVLSDPLLNPSGQGWVLVQHGVRNHAMAAARTRAELVGTLAGAMTEALRRGGNWKRPQPRDVRRWARKVGSSCRAADIAVSR